MIVIVADKGSYIIYVYVHQKYLHVAYKPAGDGAIFSYFFSEVLSFSSSSSSYAHRLFLDKSWLVLSDVIGIATSIAS